MTPASSRLVAAGRAASVALAMLAACERPGDTGRPDDSDPVVDTTETDDVRETDVATFPHENIAADIQAPFGEPMPWVSGELLDAFYRGKAIFTRKYKLSEGAGPDLITVSCVACHERPTVGGSAPLYRNTVVVGRVEGDAFVISDGPEIPIDTLNGAVLRFYRFGADGRARGPLPHQNIDMFASVNPIPMYGAGLFGTVTDETLQAMLDPDDADGDGVSARAFENQLGLGRIGFKSQAVSMQEIITSSFNLLSQVTIVTLTEEERARLPFGDVGDPRQTETDVDGVAEPELPASDLWDVIVYAQLLAAPEFDPMTERDLVGRDLFDEIGCATCHIPRLDSDLGPLPAYTDLLLHDMGSAGDGIALTFGNTQPYELRTSPLWGVAAAAPYLRDGRAMTLDDAIRGHDGEGAGARNRYLDLTEEDRASIVSFLRTLGGAEYGRQARLHPDEAPATAGELGGPELSIGTGDADFEQGRSLFDYMFGLADGLGDPYFNGDSCSSCHFEPTLGGSGPIDVNAVRQGRVDVDGNYVQSPFGDVVPKHRLDANTPYGTDLDAQIVEHRQTTSMYGNGAIESISDATIMARHDPDDANEDGISGRAAVLPGGALGRFGWKASVPSSLLFTCHALDIEMGLTTSPSLCGTFGLTSDTDAVPDPEVADEIVLSMTDFVRQLAPPSRGRITAAATRGEQTFTTLGCAACHVPSLPGSAGPVPLFSDLLLHDVSRTTRPGIEEGVATMSEYRTPPLWGVRNSGPYMHTGEAEDLDEAIRMHGGEATTSRTSYELSPSATRADLVAFLLSL